MWPSKNNKKKKFFFSSSLDFKKTLHRISIDYDEILVKLPSMKLYETRVMVWKVVFYDFHQIAVNLLLQFYLNIYLYKG